MQKCASPQRTPHALPEIFAGGSHSQRGTCSGFLHVCQQKLTCSFVWAHELALEQPLGLAVVVHALTCRHTCTLRVLWAALSSVHWLA